MTTIEKSAGPTANGGMSDAGGEMSRVLIASDVRLYREGLAATLSRLGRLSIVGTLTGSDLTLASLLHFSPHVVLLDAALSGCLGLPANLHTERPVKFIAFAVSESDDRVLECAEAGFSGYVGKDGSVEDLIQTIERALRDEVLCPPNIAGALFRRLATLGNLNSHRPYPNMATLTRRELEIIELVDRGHPNKEIARRLRIGPATVKNHIHNILEKLGVHRRAEAAAAVRSMGARLHRRDTSPM
jgi:two-component system, NarL family, nitrate/nitrite response regulator NarL